jgi:hypothetical protein
VPTQWHRQPNGSYGQTPIPGVTGRAAFLTAEQACPDNLVLHRTGGPECIGNLAKPALRPPAHVTGFDVDHYGGKTGGDTITALEKLLGPLPPTYSLTARGPYQPSRRLWFRHPCDLVIPDRVFTEYGGCVETVRTGHRFSWTDPAIHTRQGQSIGPVRWYDPDGCPTSMPHVDMLCELSSAWVEYVRAHSSARANNAEPGEATPKARDAVDGGIAKMVQRLYSTPPAGGKFRSDVFGLAAELTRREIARGTTTDNVMVQMRQIFADHPQRLTLNADDEQWISEGVQEGVATPYRFVAAEDFDFFGNYRPGRQSANGLVSEHGPPVGLDPGFWAERPVLQHIYDFAESRELSPWAQLGCVLAAVIAATPYYVGLPPIIGGFGSLNMFIALVGESGDGKGGSMSVTHEIIDLTLGTCFDTHSLGTGQGIAHGYARLARGRMPVVERHADSVMFTVEEIDHLAGHAAQNGSTVLAELCRLYMGERLGHLYVDPTKRMPVAEHSYRGVLIAGVQPGRAGVLINAADGGIPQRFLWLPTLTPPPEVLPAEPPTPWPWKPPQWVAEGRSSGSGRVTMEVPECVVSAVKAARRARRLGQGDPLDGHRLFCQEKVAVAFGILDGRCAGSEDDWQLAARLTAVSDATRAEVIARLAAKASQENRSRGKAQGEREVASEDVKEKAAVARVAQSVLRALPRNGEWMTHNELRKGLSGTTARNHLPAAVTHLEAAGQLISEEVKHRGQIGTRYQRIGNSQ